MAVSECTANTSSFAHQNKKDTVAKRTRRKMRRSGEHEGLHPTEYREDTTHWKLPFLLQVTAEAPGPLARHAAMVLTSLARSEHETRLQKGKCDLSDKL